MEATGAVILVSRSSDTELEARWLHTRYLSVRSAYMYARSSGCVNPGKGWRQLPGSSNLLLGGNQYLSLSDRHILSLSLLIRERAQDWR
jgi:hypothetical protein